VPESADGVPAELLTPRETWKDKDAYDRTAREVAGMFAEKFAEYRDAVTDEVAAAGPSA